VSRRVNYRRGYHRELTNNEYRDSTSRVDLICGHHTHAEPLATKADGKGLYTCPEGCGLKERKR
jgi:hypothetical protein